MTDAPPPVKLGRLAEEGIAPSLFALIERGAARNPGLAASLRGKVEICLSEGYPPVRITFGASEIKVEDSDGSSRWKPDLTIRGSLPDVVHLAAVPLMGGVPKPTSARGRAALGKVTSGKVKIQGSRQLGRRLLKLLQVDG